MHPHLPIRVWPAYRLKGGSAQRPASRLAQLRGGRLGAHHRPRSLDRAGSRSRRVPSGQSAGLRPEGLPPGADAAPRLCGHPCMAATRSIVAPIRGGWLSFGAAGRSAGLRGCLITPRVRLACAGSSGARTQGGRNSGCYCPDRGRRIRADPPPPDVRGGCEATSKPRPGKHGSSRLRRVQ